MNVSFLKARIPFVYFSYMLGPQHIEFLAHMKCLADVSVEHGMIEFKRWVFF